MSETGEQTRSSGLRFQPEAGTAKPDAAEHLEAVAAVTDDTVTVIQEVVADKG